MTNPLIMNPWFEFSFQAVRIALETQKAMLAGISPRSGLRTDEEKTDAPEAQVPAPALPVTRAKTRVVSHQAKIHKKRNRGKARKRFAS